MPFQSPNIPNQWPFLGGAAQGQALSEPGLLGVLSRESHVAPLLSFRSANSRTSRATSEPQMPVTTSPTALDPITPWKGGTRQRSRVSGPPRPRPGPAPASRWIAVTCPDPAPQTRPFSRRASLPPEVGRFSLSGYGSPSGGGGRTGQPSGGGGGGGDGNGGAGAGAERSRGDEGRGLRGRPAPGPAGTGRGRLAGAREPEAEPGRARWGGGGRAWPGSCSG